MTDTAETQKRRIHVGGLFPTITASELSDKFSKFGNVTNIELKVRKNENGTPEKTFAYVDFVSTEGNWKKCVSTFNHSKWKGSELKLELAKPSFLERLADERQHDKDEDLQQPKSEMSHLHNPLQNLADSQSFELRGAVPGTPIPGETNWVVGKYGRILPILHLKKDGKQKLITHDPSKYCHSLKKLKVDDPDNITPTDLTWEITHTDSEVMKKQMGRFSSWTSKKKTHTDQNYMMLKKFYDKKLEESRTGVKNESDSDEFEVVKASSRMKDGNDSADSADTDEIIANTHSRHKTASKRSHVNSEQNGANSDKNVTNNKFSKLTTYNSSKGDSSSSIHNYHIKPQDTSTDNLTYNSSAVDSMNTSVDTNCSIKVLKKTKLSSAHKNTCRESTTAKKGKRKLTDSVCTNDLKSLETKTSEHSDISNTKDYVHITDSSASANMSSPESSKMAQVLDRKSSKAFNSVPEFKGLSMLSSGSESDEPSRIVTKCEINTNVTSLKTLSKSANADSSKTDDEDSDNCDENSNTEIPEKDSDNSDKDTDAGSTSSADTDDIISHAKPKVKTKSKQQSQKWWNSMDEYSSGFSIIDGDISYTQSSKQSDDDDFDDDFVKLAKLVERTEMKIMSSTPNPVANNRKKEVGLSHTDSCMSCEDSFSKDATKASKKRKTQSTAIAEQLPESSRNIDLASVELKGHKQTTKKVNISSELADKKHADDNLKRIQSVKEREREHLMKKAILQKALSNVDGVSTANKKIIFDSDDDDFDLPPATKPLATDKETVDSNKQHVVNTGPSLFDSADEDDENDDKADGDRFHLKQHYEGKSGRKLLALQSRIGADERFRLDERFADSEEEDVSDHDEGKEQSEKARNMKILESVVGPAKLYKHDARKKQFTDISGVRFDPTCEAHSQFEIKRSETEVSKNVSKPENRKKKKSKTDNEEDMEAELPEVDKARHFEVSSSLKDAFKKTLTKASFSLLSTFGTSEHRPQASNEEEKSEKTSVLLPWRQDSNSDDELKSASDNNEDSSESPAVTNVRAPPKVVFPVKNRTFFFTADDERLEEGIKYFQRPANYEEVVRKWREKRRDLIDAFKLKHKRALKKLQLNRKFNKNKTYGKSEH